MGDALRPSFFELFACEELSCALRPALRFALEVLSVRHPSLVRVAERADEVFLTLSLLFETTSLRRERATVAEAFYALRRARSLHPSHKPVMSTLAVWRVAVALMWTVVVPYGRRKCDDVFSRRRGGAAAALFENGPPMTTQIARRRVRQVEEVRDIPVAARVMGFVRRIVRDALDVSAVQRGFDKWYPLFTACTDGAQMMCRLLYLFNFTNYFAPSLAVQGVVLRRVTAAEHRAMMHEGGRNGSVAERIARGCDGVVAGLKYGFFVALVAFRFLEYYHAAEVSIVELLKGFVDDCIDKVLMKERICVNECQDQAPVEHAPVPPPPEPLRPAAESSVKISERNDLCPLCSKTRVNPAALTVSGYVFCYVCILQYVVQNEKCPVTLLPASSDDISRVYHQVS